MPTPHVKLAAQVGRVPSMRAPLDAAQELRFNRLMEDLVLIDVRATVRRPAQVRRGVGSRGDRAPDPSPAGMSR